MINTDFRYGFRVLGDCRQPRRLVDAGAALAAYARCDERAELHTEAYLSAYQFAGDFKTHLERTGSTANFGGPCWSPWLWFDVDRDDIGAATLAARRLATVVIERCAVAEDDVLAFYSGSKGYHIGVPTALWEPEPSATFNRTARRVAENLSELADVTTDTGVYDTVRLFRAPNSRHAKTGRYKRRLSTDELMQLSPNAILAMAQEPAPFVIPTPSYRSEPAAALWATATEQVQSEAGARAGRRASGASNKINRATFAFIHDGATAPGRHKMLYSAAANLAELGAPLPLCAELLTEAALDSGLSPSDTRRGIECGWASQQPGTRETCKVLGGEVVDVQPTPAGGVA